MSEYFFETGYVADTYHMFKGSQNFTRGFMQWAFVRGQEDHPCCHGPLNAIDLAPYVVATGQEDNAHAGLRQYLLNVQERQTEEDHFTPQVFQTAADWISQNADNAPFFLWVDSFAPHEYWDPPTAFADPAVKDFIVPSMCDESEAGIRGTKALYYGMVT